jgi:hypothetical protein
LLLSGLCSIRSDVVVHCYSWGNDLFTGHGNDEFKKEIER